MTETLLLKRGPVVEAHLGHVWPPAVDDEVAEALAEVGLVVEAAAVGEHLGERRGLLAAVDAADLLGLVLGQEEVDLRLGLVGGLDQVARHALRPPLPCGHYEISGVFLYARALFIHAANF